MRIKLVPIGNSQGIRLPKSVVEQAKLTTELELEVGDGKLTLRNVQSRHNWEADAMACHEANEDRLDDWDATTADFEGDWE